MTNNIRLLVFIHRPLSRLYHSPIEKISQCARPPSQRQLTGEEETTYWLHTKKTLEAAEAAISLYALPCDIIRHTPLGICSLAISTLANLSACTYILTGPEWYRTRDRIRLGLGGLKAFGETWPLSCRTGKETKMIARSVFALPKPGTSVNHSDYGIVHPPASADCEALDAGWQELNGIDYFGPWNGLTGMDGIQT